MKKICREKLVSFIAYARNRTDKTSDELADELYKELEEVN